MNRRNLIGWIVLIFLVIGAVWSYQNRYEISDWWQLRGYEPSPLIEDIASKASLNDLGRRLFYVHDPAVLSKAEFNVNCDLEHRGLVLGCYDGLGIYILDVTEEDLEKVEQVTAAHEVLHAAYDRLSNSEREYINGLLAVEYDRITDERLLEIIRQYQERDPTILNNELHSIIGTEVEDISFELEQHYAQYFEDRKLVVATSQEYESVFTKLEERIESLENQLNAISSEIDSRELDLNSQRAQIDAARANLDSLLAEDKISAYNAAVPGFNSLVSSYNSQVETVQDLINQYNTLLPVYQDTAFQQNEYVNNLNSAFEPI